MVQHHVDELPGWVAIINVINVINVIVIPLGSTHPRGGSFPPQAYVMTAAED